MTVAAPYDVVVVGAGVFGAWTALHLAKRRQRVLMIEAYGPAHSRASSGGETRIIRMSYGADEIYTRWSQDSLRQWKELFAKVDERLFQQTGVLWLAEQDDSRLQASMAVLRRYGVKHETLKRPELKKRYPQVNFDGVTQGLFETESGVLLARRAVSCAVQCALQHGAQLQIAQVLSPHGTKRLEFIETSMGVRISARDFVFACGPWLGKVFPQLLADRIFPSRQEVFFFGIPPADTRFAPPALPTWLFQAEEFYGMPDLESRGLKVALDKHGEPVDPDTQSRLVSQDGAKKARSFVVRRFPALRDSPIVETRVCQYENTSNGDFLIDQHPEMENVWLVGGGSGHGFKHGPAFGAYTATMVLGEGQAEPRFALASKATKQERAIF
jgi:sarcosine oxidase